MDLIDEIVTSKKEISKLMTKKGFNNKEAATCSFCGRTEEDVEKLISGPNVYICDNCIRLVHEYFRKKTPNGRTQSS